MTLSRSEIWRQWFPREADLISPITGRSWNILADWSHGPIDVAFLDGDHSRTAVARELALLSSLMAPDGVIVLDDYHLGGQCVSAPFAARQPPRRQDWGMFERSMAFCGATVPSRYGQRVCPGEAEILRYQDRGA